MENSMEDYKKISDSVKSYSDIELDLIKRGLVDFSKKYLFYKYFLEEFGVILDLIEKIDDEMNKRIDDEMNKRGEIAYAETWFDKGLHEELY